jgi:predicted dehydrogenase
VAFILRYDPRLRRARELLASGALGAPVATRIVFAQERAREYWSSGLTGRVTSDWRGRKATAGGGVLIMNACHLLDGMSWLLDTPVQEVNSCDARFAEVDGVEVEDTVSLTYRYASGAIGTLEATTASAGPPVLEESVLGRQGRLMIAPTLKVWSRNTVQGFEAGRWHSIRTQVGGERERFFAAFAASISNGTLPPVTASEARSVQATISAAYLASAERRTVALAELEEPGPGARS